MHSALAQEQQFTNYHCALTPPLGWSYLKVPPQPGLLVTYASRNHKCLLMLIVNDRQKVGPINDRFMDEFERGIQIGTKGKDKRISGRITQVAGLPAYERFGETTLNGKPVSTWSQNLPANGVFYTIQAMRFDGKADEDVETRQGMESFRFLGEPAPPKVLTRDTRAYRFGYLFGYWMARIVLPLIAVAGVIVLIVVLVAKRRKAGPPPIPQRDV